MNDSLVALAARLGLRLRAGRLSRAELQVLAAEYGFSLVFGEPPRKTPLTEPLLRDLLLDQRLRASEAASQTGWSTHTIYKVAKSFGIEYGQILPETSRVGKRSAVREVEPADDLAMALWRQAQEARPRLRSECIDGPRPCPWVSCRHHLYLEVRGKSIYLTWEGKEPWELEETCALDIADSGAHTHEEVARILNVSRARIQQIEGEALEHAKKLLEPEEE